MLWSCFVTWLVIKFSYTTYEKLWSDLFAKPMPFVRQGVRDANFKVADFRPWSCFLCRGSSRIPKVRELLKLEFMRDSEHLFNLDEAIAYFGAVMAFQLATPGLLHFKRPVFFRSLSKRRRRIRTKLLSRTLMHTVWVKNWAGDWEGGDIKDDKLAERLVREGTKGGDVRISDTELRVEVKIRLDADGVIEASVRDMQSGRTKTIKLNRRCTWTWGVAEYWGEGARRQYIINWRWDLEDDKHRGNQTWFWRLREVLPSSK